MAARKKTLPAQARRRARREAARHAKHGPTATLVATDETALIDLDEFRAYVGVESLAASGSTSLPLSDREAAWDASAAQKSLDPGQFADAHFWRDPEGKADEIGSYKLPFARNDGGKLTAIWSGVTGAAGAVQGARGGVSIPDADVAGVKAKIGAYYTKAAKEYDDPEIKTPWSADADAESFDVMSGACADCGHDAMDHYGDMNVGKCGMEGCDCMGFKIAAAVEEGPITVTESNGLTTLTINSYSLDGGQSWVTGDGTAGTFQITVAEGTLVGDVETAAGATNPDIPPKHQTQETLPPLRETAMPNPDASDESETPEEEAAETPEEENSEETPSGREQGTGQASMNWTAVFAPEGRPTDDGRIFAPNAISWRSLPLSLGAMFDTPHADVVTASPVVGRIDKIYRSGDQILGEGVFDNSDLGREVARMVTDGTLTGISVDIAVSKMEIAWKSEILDADGAWKGGDAPAAQEDGDGGPSLVDILFDPNPDDEVMYVVWEGTIGAVTICPFPAFAEAHIAPASSLVAAASDLVWTLTQQHGIRVTAKPLSDAERAEAEQAAVTASAASDALTAAVVAPETPPAWWFDDPEFTELTALTITDEGQIYGHAAPWDTCHVGIPGVCTTAPSSESGYAYFHLKEVECDDGVRVSCGTITLGTGHANRNLGRADAAAHYDNTGTAVADVVCGEDEHGIWYAGALRPYLDEKTVREFRGAAVSGDWRNVNGNLEFIALLAVNVPGFPVPKVRAMVAAAESGFEVLSLTAAGIHAGQEGLTRREQAQFDALKTDLDGGFDEIASDLEEA